MSHSFDNYTGSPIDTNVLFTVTNGEQFNNDNEYDEDTFETDINDNFRTHNFQSEGASNVPADWSSSFLGMDEEVDSLVDRIEDSSLSWTGNAWRVDERVSDLSLSPRAASVQSATSRRPSRRNSNERPRSRTSRDKNAAVEISTMPYYASGTNSNAEDTSPKKVSYTGNETISPKARVHKTLQNTTSSPAIV